MSHALPARGESTVIDDFADIGSWTATASEGSRVWITREPGRAGSAMRVGFELNPGGGYVIVRRPVSLTLPENWAFSFWLRGESKSNNFEFKLVEARNRSVWWRQQRDFVFPTEWQQTTVRKSRVTRAWGEGPVKQVSAIELAVSAVEGGTGFFVVEDLRFEEREPAGSDGHTPEVTASSSQPDHPPGLVLDGEPRTAWHSEPLPREQWLLLDFGRNRELGGLVIDWDREDWATAFEVQVSNDGATWTSAYRTSTGRGGRDYIYMPDAEARFVRLLLQRSSRGRGYGIAEVRVEPVEFSASPNQFFEAIARDAPTGAYPKYLYGKQTYWTVVGIDGDDDKKALLNEEGMLEVDKGQFSIEPFLYTDDGLVTWGNVSTEQHLKDGYLPIPSVVWRSGALRLTTTAFATGEPGRSVLYARYRVENTADRGAPATLFVALRPFQVNPPWQTLNTSGGVTHIQEIRFDGRTVWVNRDKAVVSLTTPDDFGAGTFEDGAVTQFLAGGKVPPRSEVTDPHGFASGALRYNLYLEAHGHAEVDLAVPFHEPRMAAMTAEAGDRASTVAAEHEEETRRAWERSIGRVDMRLPLDGEKLVRTLKSTLAYTLVNRDGPAIRPGPRNYARSWIRDGAMTSVALLSMGFTEEPREFLRWYATFQGPDGKVPCCVDRRGPDPTLEHDSSGAFVWAVAEYYRYTRDVGFLTEMWPRVVRAVDYLAALRKRRTTDEFRGAEKEVFFGILPESISHEGYAAHPVHSYWDDFFALRAFDDAADLARVVGDDEHADGFAALRDAFRDSLMASITRTIARRGIDYVPGSVELADFDPTSTSVAFLLGGDLERLPEPALSRTFERYWEDFRRRLDGTGDWEEYSPYELRNVAAFVRLGQRDRALTLLRAIVADQRPPAWNEWPEIIWRDPEAPRFIGDMPHTWVGAGFVASLRTLFAYERDTDGALVLAAGVPPEWVTAEGGVVVKRLPTHWGTLGMTLKAEGADAVRVRLTGDVAVPQGKIVLRSPLERPLRTVTVNGRSVEGFGDGEVAVAAFPADVVLGY